MDTTGPRRIAAIDIDGVLADVRHRLPLVERRPKDWEAFFDAAAQDGLFPEGAAVAARLAAEHDLVYVTGRPERCRPDTLDWFSRHRLPVGRLIMRSPGDRRPGAFVKTAIWQDLGGAADIAVVVDDDPTVIAAADRLGIPTLLADWMPAAAGADEVLHTAQRDGRT